MPNSESPDTAVLALNPAVDISYEIPQLIPEQKVRSARTRYHAGGNGINVTRGLRVLGVPVRCCSIVGGESGKLLLQLLGDSLGESHRYVEVEGETRVNATLLQKHPPSQYEVDSVGPEISPETLQRVTECFLDHVTGGGIGVLTGSTPPGVPEDTYRQLIERIRDQGGRAVLDAHGPVLEDALQARPHMVRLNRYVLEMTFKRRMHGMEDLASAARQLQKKGIEFVCISLGTEGALLSLPGTSYFCGAPKTRVRSTVGCGDAMVAGMVAAMHRDLSPADMLRLGVICGSATASHPGTGLFTRDQAGESHNLELKELHI